MKTYILRDPNPVEPQNPRPLRQDDPALSATVDVICGPPAAPPPALAERTALSNRLIALF